MVSWMIFLKRISKKYLKMVRVSGKMTENSKSIFFRKISKFQTKFKISIKNLENFLEKNLQQFN